MHAIHEALRRKHGLPEDFCFFRWEVIEGGLLIEGGVFPAVKTGPRKGLPNYRKGSGMRKFLVSDEEGKAMEAEYEAATGKCVDCRGTGKTVASIGVNGTTYRECRRCGGSGRKS